MLRYFLLSALLLPVTGCSKSLQESECEALLDRYTDKVIDQSRPTATSAERAKLLIEARQKAALDPEFAECSNEVDRAQFECAMEAGSADQIERCLL